MKNLFYILLVILLNTSLLSAKESTNPRINELFEILAYETISFVPTGAVCERVAEIELLSQYPQSDYKILSGLEYHNEKEAIGELDIVVLDLKTNRVEVVYEVKCWKSFKGGLKKAREQRNRFINNLKYDIKIIDRNKIVYNKEKFMNIREFKTVSQQGGLNEGFDVELSLTLKELMQLRSKLLDCYAIDQCPRTR